MDNRIVPACGTLGGYRRHWRRGEPIDDACRAAHNEYHRKNKAAKKPPKAAMACLFCGKEFVPRSSLNKGLCSQSCSTKYGARLRRGPLVERKCEWCMTPFLPGHRDARLCSSVCRNAMRPLRDRGIAASDYASLVQGQGGRCAICGDPLAPDRRSRHIDHDHATGKVRGVLCPPCNLMLGHARDNPGVLLAAVEYLQRHTH